ncbi:nucleotide excision repair endonuclease [Priestia aryabhattai]
MILINVPDPDVTIYKSDNLGPAKDTPASRLYGFIDYKDIPRKVAGIYMFFDKDGQLLYVGQAVSLRSRVREHFYSSKSAIKDHRGEVFKISVFYVKDALDRELYETYIINKYKAKYNVGKVFGYKS